MRTADLSIAKAHGADVAAIERLRAAATESATSGEFERAEAHAKDMDEALDAILAKLSPYSDNVARLDEIGRLMGSVEPAMFDDNPDASVVELMKPYRERYWAIHPRWAQMYEDLLSGAGSAKDVEALASEAKKIVAEIRRALGDRPMYPKEAGS